MSYLDRMIAYLRHDTSTGIQLRELDAFRGWACLGVFFYHCLVVLGWGRAHGLLDTSIKLVFTPFRVGWLGLDIFFFLSGFLLYLKFGNAYLSGRPRPGYGEYFKRRLKRIVPAYYASIAIIVAVGVSLYPASFDFAGIPDVISHVLFMHSVLSDYVGTINGTFWTLGLEMQFYLVLPFMASWFHHGRWPYALAGVVVAVGCFKAGVLTYYHNVHFDAMYPPLNLLAWRLDQFAVGMTFGSIWIASEKGKMFNPLKGNRAASVAALVGGAGLFYYLVASGLRSGDLWAGPGLWSSIYRSPLLAVCIGLVVIATMNLRLAKSVIANRVIEFVGVVSYSMYLWHYAVLVQLKKMLPQLAHPGPVAHPFVYKLIFITVALIITVAGSTASYALFERPFLKRRRPHAAG